MRFFSALRSSCCSVHPGILLMLVPPLLILWCIVQWHMEFPQGDTWIFLTHWLELKREGWSAAAMLRPHGEHVIPVPRVIFSAAVEVLGERLWLLCLLSWGFTAAALLAMRRLALRSGVRHWLPSVLGSAMLFSPAQGETWTWEFVFGNFLPGACLMLILWLRPGSEAAAAGDSTEPGPAGKRTWLRWMMIAALALAAAGCFRSGVVCLLPPAVAALIRQDRSLKKRLAEAAGWLGAAAVLVVVTGMLTARGADPAAVKEAPAALGNPVMAMHYFTVLCGLLFAWTGAAEPALTATVTGAVTLALFGWCTVAVVRRRDARLSAAAAPWIGAGAAGAASAALITLGRMRGSVESALAERYLTMTLFLPLALCFLVPLVLRPREGAPAASRERRLAANTSLAAAAAVLWLLSIAPGTEAMRWWQVRTRQYAAAIFCHAWFPAQAQALLDEPPGTHGWQSVPALQERGLWKDWQIPGDGSVPWSFAPKEIVAGRASFQTLTKLADGSYTAEGRALLPGDRGVPDLVVLTTTDGEGNERVLTACVPNFPQGWLHRAWWRKQHPAFYNGWNCRLPAELTRLIPEGAQLRASALDLQARRLYRIGGLRQWLNGSFAGEPRGGP